MRIAIVVPYSLDVPGGVATHAMGEAQWLRSQGHDVTVIAPGTIPPPPGVMVLGPSFPVRCNGSVARLALAPSQRRAVQRAVADADVVHVHEPLTPGIGFAAARAARRLVVTHHASFAVPGWLARVLHKRARRLGQRRSVAVSHAAQRTAQAVTGAQPRIIPNAIWLPPRPSSRKALFRGGDRPTIGFMGRATDPRKGFDAFCAIAQGMDVRAVALGPGTERAPAHVAGLGLVDAQQRHDWLAQIDVLVAPNTHGESFGLILVEALAAGCHVAASDVPGFQETLSGLDAVARIFSVADIPAAIDAIDALCQRLDPQAAWRAAHRWDWHRVGPRLMAELHAAPRVDLPRT